MKVNLILLILLTSPHRLVGWTVRWWWNETKLIKLKLSLVWMQNFMLLRGKLKNRCESSTECCLLTTMSNNNLFASRKKSVKCSDVKKSEKCSQLNKHWNQPTAASFVWKQFFDHFHPYRQHDVMCVFPQTFFSFLLFFSTYPDDDQTSKDEEYEIKESFLQHLLGDLN